MQGGGTDKQRGRSTLKRMGEIYATDLRKATDQCDVDSSKRWTVDRRTSSSNGFGNRRESRRDQNWPPDPFDVAQGRGEQHSRTTIKTFGG